MAIKSPLNKLIVQVDAKYIRHFSNIMKAANLNPANQLNPADLVNIIGRVVAVPQATRGRSDYEGYSFEGVRVGDSCLFRYDVIYNTLQVGDEFFYKNYFWFKGEEYWVVEPEQLFALIRPEGITMLNGYVMVEEVSRPTQIVLPQYMSRLVNASSGLLTQIDGNQGGEKPVAANRGDRVFFNQHKAQHYEIREKKFSILRQKDLLGVWK